MIDAMTRKPLSVSTGGAAGPYLVVQVEQVDEIRRLLDEQGVGYWAGEFALSMDGGPEKTFINFGPDADTRRIQAALDGAR
jgi:hypothetical protein